VDWIARAALAQYALALGALVVELLRAALVLLAAL